MPYCDFVKLCLSFLKLFGFHSYGVKEYSPLFTFPFRRKANRSEVLGSCKIYGGLVALCVCIWKCSPIVDDLFNFVFPGGRKKKWKIHYEIANNSRE